MSDETSAAIAERVVDEWADKNSQPMSRWQFWSDNARDRFVALVDAARPASSDLDAIKREAANKAFEAAALWGFNREQTPTLDDWNLARSRYLAAHHPAPVPEPPHVMVNGWRVTWDGERYVARTESGREHISSSAACVCVCITLGNADDRDVVRVLALREGRGDQ